MKNQAYSIACPCGGHLALCAVNEELKKPVVLYIAKDGVLHFMGYCYKCGEIVTGTIPLKELVEYCRDSQGDDWPEYII